MKKKNSTLKVTLILFQLFFFLSSISNYATCQNKDFQFKDLHPEANIDSLEKWIASNPNPSKERLKNLIKAELTYVFTLDNNQYKFLNEIESLSKRYSSKTATNASVLIKFNRLRISFDKQVYQQALNTMLDAKKNNDSILYINLVRAKMYLFRTYQAKSVRDELKVMYDELDRFYKPNRDVHETIAYLDSKVFNVSAITKEFNLLRLDGMGLKDKLDIISFGILFISKHPETSYAMPSYKYKQAQNLLNRSLEDCKKGIVLMKELLDNTPERMSYLKAVMYGSLANSCNDISINQKIFYQNQVIKYTSRREVTPLVKFEYFLALKDLYKKNKNFEQATLCADSSLVYYNKFLQSRSEFDAAELGNKHNISQKEAELKIANIEKKFYIKLVSAAAFLLIILFFTLYKLSKSNKALEKTTKIQNKLFTVIAHDLKSPLNTYQRFSEIVKFLIKTKQTKRLDETLKQIDEIGYNTAGLLDNLLKWSLIQQKNNQNIIKINTEDILKNILPLYRDMAELKAIKFKENVINDELLTDRDSFAFIIRNLLDNAIKYTPEGSKIELDTVKKDNFFIVSITNKTIEIKEDVLNKIKQLFNNEKKFEIGEDGLGVGIILIKQFADSIKAKLVLETSYDEFITFKVFLPLMLK